MTFRIFCRRFLFQQSSEAEPSTNGRRERNRGRGGGKGRGGGGKGDLGTELEKLHEGAKARREYNIHAYYIRFGFARVLFTSTLPRRSVPVCSLRSDVCSATMAQSSGRLAGRQPGRQAGRHLLPRARVGTEHTLAYPAAAATGIVADDAGARPFYQSSRPPGGRLAGWLAGQPSSSSFLAAISYCAAAESELNLANNGGAQPCPGSFGRPFVASRARRT